MGTLGPITISGDGSQLIDGGTPHQVYGIDSQLVVPSVRVQWLSSVVPRKVINGGWIALLQGTNFAPYTGPLFEEVLWWSFVEFENQGFQTNLNTASVVDTLLWHLDANVVELELYW